MARSLQHFHRMKLRIKKYLVGFCLLSLLATSAACSSVLPDFAADAAADAAASSTADASLDADASPSADADASPSGDADAAPGCRPPPSGGDNGSCFATCPGASSFVNGCAWLGETWSCVRLCSGDATCPSTHPKCSGKSSDGCSSYCQVQ